MAGRRADALASGDGTAGAHSAAALDAVRSTCACHSKTRAPRTRARAVVYAQPGSARSSACADSADGTDRAALAAADAPPPDAHATAALAHEHGMAQQEVAGRPTAATVSARAR